jgi:tetratricopeptide (TPR) repeat protein
LLREALNGCRQQNIACNSLYRRIHENVGALLCQVLDATNDYTECDKLYTELLRDFPVGIFIGRIIPTWQRRVTDLFFPGDYAVFLHRRQRDFTQAEAFYLKAIDKYPNQSSIRLKYAGFLRHVRKVWTTVDSEC